jgi:4-hydroxyphenylacetate 3-monooxygenase
MAATETSSNVAARTGAEFLEGLRNDKDREIWIGGECVANPMDHEFLATGAKAIARVFDTQHEHAEVCLAPNPDDGKLVDLLPHYTSDAALLQKVLVDNPSRLYA